ncbi:glycoside hydrolase family 28 protein [Chitinophagaceae bacterium MMS25-I14]
MSHKVFVFLITITSVCSCASVFAQSRSRVAKEKNLLDERHITITQPSFKNDTFSIRKYGAVADGITLNTDAINKTIIACNAHGGGVVYIPDGIWLTGPLELKSNVNLNLAPNALLQFTSDKSQYKLIEGNWEGKPSPRNQSPITASGAENIAITGSGIIDGNGDAWRAIKKDKLTGTQWKKKIESGGVLDEDGKTWYPSAEYMLGAKTKNAGDLSGGKTVKDYENIKAFFRPNLVVFSNCSGVLLQGITFQNSPAWCLHMLTSNNIVVDHIMAKNPWYAQNGDGIDIESCKNVSVTHSVFDVGDDGICLKSGRDEAGRKRGMPSENVMIKNCAVYHAHGGVVIGSEMSGGVRNIDVSDCTFIGTDIGLRFKTARGRGGIVEKISVKGIVMKDIVGDAILFDMYYEAKDPIILAGEQRKEPAKETFPVTDATPQFRDFNISNIVCIGAERAIFMRGLPEMNVTQIHLSDLIMKSRKGIEITEASNITLDNVQVITSDTEPVIVINNASGILFNSIQYADKAALLFHISGDKSTGIAVKNTNTSNAINRVIFSDGAKEKALDVK